MTNHLTCTKEKEIVEMATNQKWIMRTLEDIAPKINDMHETFTQGEGKIKVLNKAIFGNGKPGIIERVEKIEETFAKFEGGQIVVKTMGNFTKWLIGILAGGNFLGIVYAVLKILNNQ